MENKDKILITITLEEIINIFDIFLIDNNELKLSLLKEIMNKKYRYCILKELPESKKIELDLMNEILLNNY